MEASAGLVAGSHNRNELVVIHGHEEVILFVITMHESYSRKKIHNTHKSKAVRRINDTWELSWYTPLGYVQF